MGKALNKTQFPMKSLKGEFTEGLLRIKKQNHKPCCLHVFI